MVSQKCQYALRAVHELARHASRGSDGPVKIGDIAKAQAIPARFLEVILGQLKQGGFVQSRRGANGGYWLARDAGELTVGEIIRFVEGPLGPVICVTDPTEEACPLRGECAFLPMWQEAKDAVSKVYDNTTFTDLLHVEQQQRSRYVPGYSI